MSIETETICSHIYNIEYTVHTPYTPCTNWIFAFSSIFRLRIVTNENILKSNFWRGTQNFGDVMLLYVRFSYNLILVCEWKRRTVIHAILFDDGRYKCRQRLGVRINLKRKLGESIQPYYNHRTIKCKSIVFTIGSTHKLLAVFCCVRDEIKSGWGKDLDAREKRARKGSKN